MLQISKPHLHLIFCLFKMGIDGIGAVIFWALGSVFLSIHAIFHGFPHLAFLAIFTLFHIVVLFDIFRGVLSFESIT